MKANVFKGKFLFDRGWGVYRHPSRGIFPQFVSRGFTLVELLVVIAIISLLMGILLPSLNRARQQAKKIVCLSNMRQMGIATQTYLMDSENRLPPSGCQQDDPEKYWLCVLTKYIKQGLLFRCPSDRSKNFVDWNMPLDEQPENLRYSSFAVNALLDPGHPRYPPGSGYNNVMRIRRPKYCIWISEAPTNNTFTRAEHIHPEQWGGSVSYAKKSIAWNRHLGTSNYLFADGHAENLKFEKTYNWPSPCYWFPECTPRWPQEP
jgi:prepilin-type N-terminal cleavage/methylation domain-containing protein/prepilin-type processing-associated H-X9-DG protein